MQRGIGLQAVIDIVDDILCGEDDIHRDVA
jgi:hypothetical protein